VAVVAVVVTSLVALGAQRLLYGSWLRVQTIEVVGSQHESMQAVIAASGLTNHPAMISVAGADVARSVAAVLPWVAHVQVLRQWPHTVVLRVTEATPVAVASDTTGHWRYVDVRGRNLGPAPAAANLPTLRPTSPTPGNWPYQGVGHGGPIVAAYVAQHLPPSFGRQISSILVTPAGTVRVALTSPLTFLLGPPTNLAAKFKAMASVIAGATLRPGDIVDLTTPEAAAVSGPTPQ
jgi:cell division protein FtsQ